MNFIKENEIVGKENLHHHHRLRDVNRMNYTGEVSPLTVFDNHRRVLRRLRHQHSIIAIAREHDPGCTLQGTTSPGTVPDLARRVGSSAAMTHGPAPEPARLALSAHAVNTEPTRRNIETCKGRESYRGSWFSFSPGSSGSSFNTLGRISVIAGLVYILGIDARYRSIDRARRPRPAPRSIRTGPNAG
ncbi:hypothetical protein EVAR_54793_1 [Eumeta japonica]|uniref:Uncharacterized protein n=1 Tax=Eumeta variegata TaxID=151549 RepID=A0A4C1Y322_EUMVA|nr:hypothetical protein EVAR_54793_1 [Eumeta japonica]